MSNDKQQALSESAGPLAGIKVLDLGTMIAGPVAGTLMADFGAEVIKVEQPGVGDTIRGVGPFSKGESLWWNVDGRNKKSITLDLRQARGQEILRKLVKEVDVVVENFRPGTLEKWNLDYENLSGVNPRLIMLSVSGFGQSGPLANRAGYDRIGLAFSGVMGMTGFADRPPVRVGTSIADYSTALMGAFSVMMALYYRDVRGGEGQQIDLALYESMFRFSDSMVAAFDQLGLIRERTGNVHFGAAPGSTFETSDGRYTIMTISGDTLFRRLCIAMEKQEMTDDPRYANHELRFGHIEELNQIVADWMKNTPAQQVHEALQANGIPFSTVLTIEDIAKHPQYKARENIVTIEHPKLGPLRMQGIVPKMSRTPGKISSAAPAVGEHNQELYRRLLGYGMSELEQLRTERVI
ncbi:formyl-CoA transferase [Advenella incenata]|jgi:crotonobetainyl-CoA:carnitine CoA-transferase CaiB-like acyl-CoA transferase|uniref:Formyl-CoA transferase n=1 Tax=Advenella incenata TaxID=267800 RepID=A0A4Q7V9A0_9BURK|nr:CoA transferase [Advenella incenata]RZT92267.1 formyl-CoA transferase [Advenella incenata]